MRLAKIHRLYTALVCVLALLFGTIALASAESYMDGELIVKFKQGTSRATIDRTIRNFGTSVLHRFHIVDAYHLKIRRGGSVPVLVERFSNHPAVEYAEPNYIVYADAVPNDLRFPSLWGMDNTGQTGGTPDADIDAPEAWDRTKGSPQVLVAVIDSGVDYNHPDLASNIWTNPGEVPGNGVDDDGNGYVDDVHGYDFANNDGDPMDDNGHGTHVSGTIGAVGNNGVGVVGVNWNVSIMALKFLGASGSGSLTNAILAIQYATDMGADLTNNSWGGGAPSLTMRDAIAASPLFVAAAGNSGIRFPHFPAAYGLDNIISVVATDHNDNLASFSNYGRRWTDLAAPGVNILSTVPSFVDPTGYASFNGTSMATPHVSGVAALILSINPTLSSLEVKNIILSSVDRKPSLAGKTLTEGRLNAAKALSRVPLPPPAAPQRPDLSLVSQRQPSDVASRTVALGQAFPNPANPEVWIPYELGSASDVTIEIHDALGQLVRRLDLGRQTAGRYDAKSAAAHWDGRNARGEVVTSGIYFYTLKAGEFSLTRKLMIVR